MRPPVHTPAPDYVGIRVGSTIWPVELPAAAGTCACEVAVGSMRSCGRVICVGCGCVMALVKVDRASA